MEPQLVLQQKSPNSRYQRLETGCQHGHYIFCQGPGCNEQALGQIQMCLMWERLASENRSSGLEIRVDFEIVEWVQGEVGDVEDSKSFGALDISDLQMLETPPKE